MKHAPPEVRCSLEACGVVWWQRAVGVWRVQKIFLESTGVSCGISGIIAYYRSRSRLAVGSPVFLLPFPFHLSGGVVSIRRPSGGGRPHDGERVFVR